MEPFEAILAAGGRSNSLGRAGEVLATVRADRSRLVELFACIGAEDPWVRMRAVDTFEKVIRDEPALVAPYLDVILTDLTRSEQASIRWHLAQIFAVVELTDAQRATAITWLVGLVETPDVDWIVAANTLTTLVGFHSRGFVDAAVVRRLCDVQANHRSKSVRAKAAALRDRL